MTWSPTYCTNAEFKDFVRIPSADTTDDAEITDAIEAASRSIDQFTCRQFGQVAAPEVRYYSALWYRGRQAFVVDVDDLMTATGLVVAIDANADLTFSTTVTGSRLLPLNALPDGRPWLQIQLPGQYQGPLAPGSIMVTAQWGWTAVPVAVKNACLLQASRYLKRREAPFGIAGSPEIGSEFRLSRWLDPDVQVMLRGFNRVWLGV